MLLHNNLVRRECLPYASARELVHQYNPNKNEREKETLRGDAHRLGLCVSKPKVYDSGNSVGEETFAHADDDDYASNILLITQLILMGG
jgi:hypothetical protein